jgi:hypothetical protein
LSAPHFLPCSGHGARPPPASARGPPLPAGGPTPHARWPNPPPHLFSPPGPAPTCPSLFSLCSTEKPPRLLMKLPSPTALLSRRAPPKPPLHCCLSPSAPESRPTKLPRLAASSYRTKLPQPNRRRLWPHSPLCLRHFPPELRVRPRPEASQ